MKQLRDYYKGLATNQERFSFLWTGVVTLLGVFFFLASLANVGGFLFMFAVIALIAVVALTVYTIRVLSSHRGLPGQNKSDDSEDV